ncbi:MAG: dihydrolipoyl dehydrogenase, partial [Oligoflexia bacterium]|nr:dihydrolipoyl dehydrogenase [Oligoflexia bacterium]
IIGSGPAGYVAAIRAAQYGMDVVLAESGRVGGTCLNSGCIPTKNLLSYAESVHAVKKGRQGLSISGFSIDPQAVYQNKNANVAKLATGIEALLKSWKIKLVRGTASFVSENSAKVGDETIGFERAVIAAGSKTIMPSGLNVPGFSVDSTYALENHDLGGRVAIIGGGIIGIELAFILNALNVEVTVIEKLKDILSTEDSDAVRLVESSLKKYGIRIYKDTSVERIENGLLELSNGERISADKCIVAVGRRPDTDGLCCDAAKIKLAAGGAVTVDGNFRTTNPDVYAVGDVTGGIQLAHYASAVACRVVADIAGKQSNINIEAVPRVVYSVPELASVGITEQEAKMKGIDYKAGKFMYGANGRALVSDTATGFIKVLSDNDGIILGATVAGSNADLLIVPFTIAMATRLSVEDLASVIYPHPTLAEMIGEACDDLHGHSIHKGRRNT